QTVTNVAHHMPRPPSSFPEFMSDSKTPSGGEIPTPPSPVLITMSAIVFVLAVFAVPIFCGTALSHLADDAVVMLCMLYILAFPVGVWSVYRRIARQTSSALQRATEAPAHLDARVRALQQEAEARKAIAARLQLALDTQSRQLATQRDFSAMVSHALRT